MDNNNEAPRITRRTKGHATGNNRSHDRQYNFVSYLVARLLTLACGIGRVMALVYGKVDGRFWHLCTSAMKLTNSVFMHCFKYN